MSFWVGVVVGASLATVVFILVPWTRRIRAETGMDDELQARVLLGEEPPEPESGGRVEHRDYDPGELAALEDLGKPPDKRRKR